MFQEIKWTSYPYFLGSFQVAIVRLWLEVFFSTFSGIALLEGVFKSHFFLHNAPLIITSYGATSILSFNTHDSSVAQLRNILFEHFVSALTGECISKLFSLSSRGRSNYWAGRALGVATAPVLISSFNCVHPPAGASALLPSTNEQAISMGWWYLPAHLVSSVLIISVALITGNIIRRYLGNRGLQDLRRRVMIFMKNLRRNLRILSAKIFNIFRVQENSKFRATQYLFLSSAI